MSKFAPITSSLLARKGEAGPSAPATKYPFAWVHERAIPEPDYGARDWTPAAAANEEPLFTPRPAPRKSVPREPRGPVSPGEKPRKISVALSPREHETLGIVAVKRNLTRHQVVRDALDAYFETLAKEYRTECNCIATGCSCAGACSAA